MNAGGLRAVFTHTDLRSFNVLTRGNEVRLEPWDPFQLTTDLYAAFR
jgi:hypothetical protein